MISLAYRRLEIIVYKRKAPRNVRPGACIVYQFNEVSGNLLFALIHLLIISDLEEKNRCECCCDKNC